MTPASIAATRSQANSAKGAWAEFWHATDTKLKT